MKTIFEINIVPTGEGGTMLRRIRDLPFLLHVGVEVGDPAWKDARKAVGVVLEFDDVGEPHAWVSFGLDKVKNHEEETREAEMHKAHGWKEPSMND